MRAERIAKVREEALRKRAAEDAARAAAEAAEEEYRRCAPRGVSRATCTVQVSDRRAASRRSLGCVQCYSVVVRHFQYPVVRRLFFVYVGCFRAFALGCATAVNPWDPGRVRSAHARGVRWPVAPAESCRTPGACRRSFRGTAGPDALLGSQIAHTSTKSHRTLEVRPEAFDTLHGVSKGV